MPVLCHKKMLILVFEKKRIIIYNADMFSMQNLHHCYAKEATRIKKKLIRKKYYK